MLRQGFGVWDQIASDWRQFRGEVQNAWPDLSDDDLAYIGGGREKLINKLQERYNLSKVEATHEVNRWANSLEQV